MTLLRNQSLTDAMTKSESSYPVIKLSARQTKQYWEIPVLYEDDQLMALYKPARLLTSPDRYDPNRPNLMKLLHQHIEERTPWAASRNLDYLANAHRLDFETSGVILLAKDKATLRNLGNQFNQHQPAKIYAALVHDTPEEDQFEINAKLAHHPTKPWLVRVDPKQGKKARTLVEVRERYRGYTLLCCRLDSGRQHQIRVHLQHVGLPVVGDTQYGGQPIWLSRLKRRYKRKPDEPEKPLIARSALHAEELHISQPTTGETVSIHAPWPKDFAVAVKYLRKFAATF